jgi:hypothetical protein
LRAQRIDPDNFPQRLAEQVDNRKNKFVDVNLRRVQGLATGKGQQPLGQVGAFRFIFSKISKHLEIHHQDGENVIEIMRHAAGKLADGFHLGCLQQLILNAPPFRDIAHRADEIPGMTIRHITDR